MGRAGSTDNTCMYATSEIKQPQRSMILQHRKTLVGSVNVAPLIPETYREARP